MGLGELGLGEMGGHQMRSPVKREKSHKLSRTRLLDFQLNSYIQVIQRCRLE